MWGKRLFSSFLLWGTLLLILFVPDSTGPWSCLVIGFFALPTVWEIARISPARQAAVKVLIASIVLLIVGTYVSLKYWHSPELARFMEKAAAMTVLIGSAIAIMTRGKLEGGLEDWGVTLLAFVYGGWTVNHINWLNFHFDGGPLGRQVILWVIIVTKFMDAGAFAVGSMIGKHKIVPSISPKKTWEGTAGGVVAATLTGVLMYLFFRGSMQTAGIGWAHILIAAPLLAIAGFWGDLAGSLLKRSAGVKDSGQIFPGIGGMLDLMDSLLFTLPLSYLLLTFL
jgi:phosphatidate cytidylyltransferase